MRMGRTQELVWMSLRRNKMTREEFYEKYKDVKFFFSWYNKYTFTFVGEYVALS